MKNTILSFNDLLYRTCIWISGASIVIMALIIPWGIFTRYVLGTGSRQQFPPQAALVPLLRLGIGVEAMDNAAAARTYNLLAGEGRRVVAAFILPGKVQAPD